MATKVLKNGAIYDMQLKRIVGNDKSLAVVDTQITQATAGAMAERRQELKRQAIMTGASRAAGDILQRPVAHELEWIEVGAEANMHRAADVGNVKGVDAFRSLLTEAGLAEQRSAAPTQDVTRDIVRDIADIARAYLLQHGAEQAGDDDDD